MQSLSPMAYTGCPQSEEAALYTTKYNGAARPGKVTPEGKWTARPRWRVSRGAEIALGPGKAALLEAIRRTGSISGAARSLGMSYRRSWVLVDTMNRCFAKPLVSTSPWRRKGATLTPEGGRVLELYRRIESVSLAASSRSLALLQALLKPGRPARLRKRGSGSRDGRDRKPARRPVEE